ncbi:hypothetical protein HD553DRAFT_326320 [Filobasidium floriforme]|uniref:uncharacterized protein n=1 Tax=Filobasidium floriforme TaxID=5210 RepID=UPI001E8CEF29|nr:uncharacterized protein HD553DRAFT_326320 [Filobasidium floriforme]KAH8080011.1 hypothetical protein HD553DRAFT_326320 [Filobasidium floriforme]
MADQIEERRSMYTVDLDLRGGFSLFPGLGEMLVVTYAEDGSGKAMDPETLASSDRRSSSSDRTTTEAPEALSEVYRQQIPRLTTPATSRKLMNGRTVAAICHGRLRKPTPRRKSFLSPARSSASKGLSASSEARSGTLEQERPASGSELKLDSAISMGTLPEQSTSSQQTHHHVKSAQHWHEEVISNFCKFICASRTSTAQTGSEGHREVPAEAAILLQRLKEKEHFRGRTEIPRWFEPWVSHARSRGIAWWHPPLDPDSSENPAGLRVWQAKAQGTRPLGSSPGYSLVFGRDITDCHLISLNYEIALSITIEIHQLVKRKGLPPSFLEHERRDSN